jgi:hypothetical protein
LSKAKVSKAADLWRREGRWQADHICRTCSTPAIIWSYEAATVEVKTEV